VENYVFNELLIGSFLFGLLFDPEHGGNRFLRNVGGLLPNYTAYCNPPILLKESFHHTLIEFKQQRLKGEVKWLTIRIREVPDSNIGYSG
jgi:hypothetical protein